MGGQKFQYDESGGTFFYFLLSFLALVLIPATFYYWPRKRKQDPDKEAQECHCPGCAKKKVVLNSSDAWQSTKHFMIKLLIISGWLLLALLAYKVSQFDYEMANFDPYEILGVPLGSSQADIKKAYRKLSVILHPDKETGNEKAFMKLTKAYQALTDDEARKNWEKYGNPDGPGAMSFGIALPSWIVEKENSVWVLGLYALIFMVALPVVVGTWWYRSIKFSGDQVLLDTTRMYYYFIHKTTKIALKRIIMILAASLEFDKRHNSEIVERQSDNEEVPHLIKQLPNLGEKNREKPLCYLYSIKTRALLHAHLSRIPLSPDTLEMDRRYILSKCPYLIQELVNCVNHLFLLGYAKRINRLPSIETIENCMKLSPMIVQGLWEFKSPLLQLPHITDDNLKYFMSKKRQIKTIQQFAQLKGEERRNILRNLSEEEYEDVMKVLGRMPYIDFQGSTYFPDDFGAWKLTFADRSVNVLVIDDENPTEVTAGAIVTVTVNLVRHDMSSLFGDDSIADAEPISELQNDSEKIAAAGDGAADAQPSKKPAWLKQKKATGKKNNKKSGKQNKINNVKPKVDVPVIVIPTTKMKSKEREEKSKDVDSDESDASDHEINDNDRSSEEEVKSSSVEDDDQEWDKIQRRLNKREVLEGKSKTSHSVHCPQFPYDKQEYWWTYICDRNSRTLLTAPFHVTNLIDDEDFQLKFTAPYWPGVYVFTVCLRSDSYIGFDQQRDIKLDVKEAPAIPTKHPQWEWEDSEDENQVEEGAHESEYTTDEDIEEEE